MEGSTVECLVLPEAEQHLMRNSPKGLLSEAYLCDILWE